jgi:hypothetical protein
LPFAIDQGGGASFLALPINETKQLGFPKNPPAAEQTRSIGTAVGERTTPRGDNNTRSRVGNVPATE